MVARGVSKPGHLPDGPDFGEARPAWGAVPSAIPATRHPPESREVLVNPHLVRHWRLAAYRCTQRSGSASP